MMIAITVVNIIVWSGFILFMLLRLTRNEQALYDQIASLEARLGQPEGTEANGPGR